MGNETPHGWKRNEPMRQIVWIKVHGLISTLWTQKDIEPDYYAWFNIKSKTEECQSSVAVFWKIKFASKRIFKALHKVHAQNTNFAASNDLLFFRKIGFKNWFLIKIGKKIDLHIPIISLFPSNLVCSKKKQLFWSHLHPTKLFQRNATAG